MILIISISLKWKAIIANSDIRKIRCENRYLQHVKDYTKIAEKTNEQGIKFIEANFNKIYIKEDEPIEKIIKNVEKISKIVLPFVSKEKEKST